MMARRFYLSGATKKEIGSQLGISSFKVARLLELARQHGLVHIEIDSPGGFDRDLASKLQDRFDLTEV
jgi:DNA-binding transcriptional regulator LsrR (DeoR family)